MADDADAFGIHLRSLREHVPRIGRRAAKHREGLHAGVFDGGKISSVRSIVRRLRGADRKRDKAAPRQLQCEIPMRIFPQPNRRSRFIKNRHHSRPLAFAIGDK